MFRNIIFDWSGTLCNDLPPVLETVNRILEHHQVDGIDEPSFRREFRLPFGDFYNQRIPGASHKKLEALYNELFPLSEKKAEPIPHALDFVAAMHSQGQRLFVLSAVTASHFHEQAAHLGFGNWFEGLYLQVRDKRQVIHDILEEKGLSPDDTCFIGDMCHDVDTANHAGITSIAVLTGYDSAEKLAGSAPDVMVAHLDQLHDWFRRSDPFRKAPICTVGALILDSEDKVLLMKSSKWQDKWGIPGGKVQRGETNLEALHREIQEETGIQIQSPEFLRVDDWIDPPEFQHPAHFLLLSYLCKAPDTKVTLNDEAEEFCWATPKQAAAMSLNAPTRLILEDWMS